MRVAIQGMAGSFHHRAAKLWFGNDVAIVPAETFAKVFALLRDNEADMALVAVENSIHGPLTETLDCIATYHYPIVGEIYLHIHQQLIGMPNASLSDITYVYSQPVALAQCDTYLAQQLPHATPVDYHDTTASVAYVREQKNPHFAAIAGIEAAEEYNLTVLAADIEDNTANFTRFLIIQPHGLPVIEANKASLILITEHTPGALDHALSALTTADINILSLQSRPVIGDAWHYRFHIDIAAKMDQVQAAADAIRKTGAKVIIIGEYKQGKTY